jgi:hypothetical protein
MTERYGSPIFYELLEKMATVHSAKSHDYASNDDPYGNYHFAGMLSKLFNNPNDAGFIGRIGEKIFRLANLENSGKSPSNESISDTELDICVICALWMADRKDRRMKSLMKDESHSFVVQHDFVPQLEHPGFCANEGCGLHRSSHRKSQ